MQLDTSNLGMRDVLASDAFELIGNNESCLIFGCGFNAFQYTYSYRFGLYPHNVLIELIVTYGLFLSSLFIIIFMYGINKMRISGNLVNSFFVIALYLFLIGLKSGTIIDLLLVGFFINIAGNAFVESENSLN